MAGSVNSVTLVGNLGADPELRSLQSGTSLCKLRLAVNERFKSGDEWQDRVNWFDITVWGGQGEACANHLSKGRQVAVQGRLRWSSWETDDGGKRSKVEVVADTVQFLGGKDGGGSGGGGGGGSRTSDVPADTSGMDGGQDLPADDDDIPF